MRAIEERTGLSLDGLEDILSSARLGSVAGQDVVELELGLSVGDVGQRKLAAAQLILLADRITS